MNIRTTEHSKRTEYIRETFAKEDENLAKVGNDLPDEERRMQIGPDEGKILFCLARMIGAKKIIEIGVLNGYSSVWLARSLAEGGKLYSLEKNYKRIQPSLASFKVCGVADKIELIEGDALETLAKLEEEAPFDMVFIDADKSNYCNYLDWAEKNVRKGGLIIGDNTLFFGAVYGESSKDVNPDTVKVMQNFNIRLANPLKYSGIMMPTSEGLTVAVKEF
jgi:predicted O-methyltransferase YrrM